LIVKTHEFHGPRLYSELRRSAGAGEWEAIALEAQGKYDASRPLPGPEAMQPPLLVWHAPIAV
jgi:hypothetical protein